MGSLKINEIGNKYGRLKVLHQAGVNEKKGALWLCLCDCGKTSTVLGTHLRRGNNKSCGCLQRDVTRTNYRKRNIVSKWANPLDSVDDDIITGA